MDKLRWPKQWENYEAGKEDALVGTPLDQWNIPLDEIREMNYFGIYTVEQLAALPDANIPMGTNWMSLKKHANEWLGEKSVADRALTEKIKQLEEKLEQLEVAPAQSADTESIIAAVMAKMGEPKFEEPTAGVREEAVTGVSTDDMDVTGAWFDKRIHDSRKEKTKAGAWMKKRGRK